MNAGGARIGIDGALIASLEAVKVRRHGDAQKPGS
jgi:hypothetical protein